MNIPKSYTTDEVAQAAHVTRRTVYSWIKEGHISAVKVGPKKWLVSESALRSLLAGRDVQPDLPEPGEVVNGKSGARYASGESAVVPDRTKKQQCQQLPLPGTVTDQQRPQAAPFPPSLPVVESPKSSLSPMTLSRPATGKKGRRR